MNDYENNYNSPENQPEQVENQQPEQQPEPPPQPQPEPQPEPQQPPYQPNPNGYNDTNFYRQKSQNYYNPYSYNNNPAPSPTKSINGGFKVFALLLAFVITLTIGTGIGYIISVKNGNSGQLTNSSTTNSPKVEFVEGKVPTKEGITADQNGNYTVEQVAELLSPSVVSIYTYNTTSSGASAASGVIIDKNGYVITNDHICSDIVNPQFVVTLNDNTSYKATFVASDQRSDIAVLKIEGASNLTPASFGKSADVTVGEKAIAIGNPNGFTNSVTQGIVSSANRRIRKGTTSSTNSTSAYTMRVIQTDTALNHGNSGGALVNLKGQVIGIVSSKIVIDTFEGVGFAIPSDDAVSIAKNLIANKKVVGRARLGITYTEISSASAIVNDCPSGLLVSSVSTDSELHNYGVGESDIITEIDGKKIVTADVALDVIDSNKSGDKVKVKVYSNSTKQYSEYTVTLLEDESTSSYKTQTQQNDTENPFKTQPTTKQQ